MLSDEQLEDIISGRAETPEDMAPSDSRRVAEMRAVRDRLRLAMASVEMDEPAVERIRRAVRDAASGAEQSPARAHAGPRVIRFPRLARWLPVAAAAIIIAVAIPFLLPDTPTAHAELVGIHSANMSGGRGFHLENDRSKLVQALKAELGYAPAVPARDSGASVVGCRVKMFRGQRVATYLIELPEGKASIVVSADVPESMKVGRRIEQRTVFLCGCEHDDCTMVAVQLGGRTYIALGKVPREALTKLLLGLVEEVRKGE